MKYVRHIIPNGNITLCGRDTWDVWLLPVHISGVIKLSKVKTNPFNFRWCKTCKKLFNANYSYIYKKELK